MKGLYFPLFSANKSQVGRLKTPVCHFCSPEFLFWRWEIITEFAKKISTREPIVKNPDFHWNTEKAFSTENKNYKNECGLQDWIVLFS